ncbi:hypothetical protein ACSFA0_22740 [Variovorax sp. LT1P1]|uniref:hypothetical protein n=1 Tax=Variovorax sp. LT1P1 TaxID=3443730 RepID=UPI003F48F422
MLDLDISPIERGWQHGERNALSVSDYRRSGAPMRVHHAHALYYPPAGVHWQRRQLWRNALDHGHCWNPTMWELKAPIPSHLSKGQAIVALHDFAQRTADWAGCAAEVHMDLPSPGSKVAACVGFVLLSGHRLSSTGLARPIASPFATRRHHEKTWSESVDQAESAQMAIDAVEEIRTARTHMSRFLTKTRRSRGTLSLA